MSAPMTPHMSLMVRVARNEAGALRACIETYRRLVRAIGRRLLRGEAELDDLVQEVFVDVWRSAERYDGRVSEATFVSMIARRRMIDHLRRASRRPTTSTLEEAAPCAGATERVEAHSEAALATKHLCALRPEQQTVLLLWGLGGLSHHEISDELGLPIGTVKAHARRGMRQLRRSLAGDQMASM